MLESIKSILEPIADMNPIGSRLGNTQKWQDYQAERDEKAKQRSFEEKQRLFEENRMNRERENWKTLDEQKAKIIQHQDIQQQRQADAYVEQYYRDNDTASVQSAKNSIRNIPAYGEMPNDVMREEISGSKQFNDYKNNIAVIRSFVDAAHLGDERIKKAAILKAKELGYDVNEDDNGEMWVHNPNDQYSQSIKVTPEVLGEITRKFKGDLEQEMKLRTGMKRAEESLVGSINNRAITELYDLQSGDKKSFLNAKKDYDLFVSNGKYTPEDMRNHAFSEGLQKLMEKGEKGMSKQELMELLQLSKVVGIEWTQDVAGNFLMKKGDGSFIPLPEAQKYFEARDRFGADFKSMDGTVQKQQEAQQFLQQKRSEVTAGKSAVSLLFGNRPPPKQASKSKETIEWEN